MLRLDGPGGHAQSSLRDIYAHEHVQLSQAVCHLYLLVFGDLVKSAVLRHDLADAEVQDWIWVVNMDSILDFQWPLKNTH